MFDLAKVQSNWIYRGAGKGVLAVTVPNLDGTTSTIRQEYHAPNGLPLYPVDSGKNE